jgi:putative hydroxymethylpyrimidine transport system substrate-binding protein
MTKPQASLMAALVSAIVALAVLLSLPLLADTPSDEDPLPAPPLQLDTRVMVFPPLAGHETQAQSEISALVEVPPVVDGLGFLPQLLGESTSPGLQAEAADEPSLAVPSVVSQPPDPIILPPVTEIAVTLDWYLNPQHATLIVAREKGMFQRRGLEVTLVTPADPNVPAKLLAAGRTDLVVGRQPQLHLQVDKGVPLVRVATLLAAPVSGLVLRAGHDNEIALEGMKLGFTDADGRDVMLASALAELLGTANGLALVELQDVDYAMLEAMRGKSVDGAMVHHRYLLPRQLADEGVLTRVLPVEELGVPVHDGLILMANRERLNGKREEIHRLVSALEEAALWIVNHPVEAWELLEASEPALADSASREAWKEIMPRLALQPAALDQGRYLRLEHFLFEAGIIEAISPMDRLAIDVGAPMQ